MELLITGANGLIGSHVVDRLVSNPDVSLRLMLRSTSDLSFISHVATSAYERVEGDMRDAASLARAVDGVDTVLHLAGATSAKSATTYEAVNARGTADLARAAADAGVKRFVYISSVAAHGPSASATPRDLEEPGQPVVAYGRSKLAGEVAVRDLMSRMNVTIVRPPVVYGPRDTAMLPLYRIARWRIFPLLGDGQNRVAFIHVHDCADAIVAVTLAETQNGAIYTVCDGVNHTWRELVQAFSGALGHRVIGLPTPSFLYTGAAEVAAVVSKVIRKELPLSPEQVAAMKPRYWVCDNKRITAELGWRPRIGINEGFVSTLRWYREQGWF